jgi:hypothetical protein
MDIRPLGRIKAKSYFTAFRLRVSKRNHIKLTPIKHINGSEIKLFHHDSGSFHISGCLGAIKCSNTSHKYANNKHIHKDVNKLTLEFAKKEPINIQKQKCTKDQASKNE